MTRMGPLRSSCAIGLFRLHRQLYRERRPLARNAADADASSHRLDDAPRDPETETEAAVFARPLCALEALEDPLLIVGRDADAVVDDAEHGALPLRKGLDLDHVALAVLEGVGDEVG